MSASRLSAKGDGWWEVWLDCGHGGAVLHGQRTPWGEHCQCFYRCGELVLSVAAVDPHATDPLGPTTRDKKDI